MKAYFAMGCFWGAQRIFADLPGVVASQVGYMGGKTPHPSYEQVCTGKTGHAETVEVTFDPVQISFSKLLEIFWSNHNSTTLNRQGNDIGTQYRSAIFPVDQDQYQQAQLKIQQLGFEIADLYGREPVTEIANPQAAAVFYPAEEYHQDYLRKHPDGYCNLGFNGLSCPGSEM